MNESKPKIVRYEDEHFYYARKPYGIPTTFGSQFSFLEVLDQERPDFFVKLVDVWTREEERGLLNRLDNDTAGLLYFAKTKEIADWYHAMQDKEEVMKRYVCDVKGNMLQFVNTDTHVMRKEYDALNEKTLCVSYPLMHHAYDDQKMIVVRNENDVKKGRGKQHLLKTYFVPISYDEKSDITTAYAIIHKGIRHQIRAHAAGMGYPLIGDILYKGLSDDHLHLRSVGLSISDDITQSHNENNR